MLVLLESTSPRVRYVVSHVLERMLGLDVRYAQGQEEFRSATGPRLSYGTQLFDGAIHIPRSGCIEELPKHDPEVSVEGGAPRMFLVNGEEDLFAGIFHLLSLTDEINCKERDVHGRVPSKALFTVRSGIADRPWVDEKVMALGNALEDKWPAELQCAVRYSNCVTVDMDNILRYAGRPFTRAVGASLKDLLRGEWSAVAERWRVRSGKQPDPFAQAIDLVASHREDAVRRIFFFLMRGGTAFDHAADHAHDGVRRVIQCAGEVGEVGIHPSYSSSREKALAEGERKLLMRIRGKSVDHTRQHFLRWDLPGTLRQLSAAGHFEDHTLGFTDRAGFRVGTCTPFPWYDLEREEETRLMLHPFAVMDSALIEQQGKGPEEVVKTMNAMSDLVRSVNGQFVSVWHDRYLSGHREFAPWPSVYERVMEHARP